MDKLVSQHTAHVRENHPVFLPGPMRVSVYQADAGHYYVQSNPGVLLATYLTRKMAEDYVNQFIHDVGGSGLVQRILDLRASMGRDKLSLLAAKRICEAKLDSRMTGDYARDIELLANHLQRD